ncbi:hypothetical protein [Ruminococcus flavefaciens]|uniref:Uncharacterized protein n=1 Tax=Ruminococcus flavefaciens 007c TaxID=1341157 RepID=W7UVI3_RUMFL|nr:hypothetical protein [Ruminococcus flavefaciens]EWM55149.1 hypothetical protein RF007C_05600 [Ruminococcus flavefaciens 007c]
MRSKKNILAAVAAMSVMASALSLNAFAAESNEVTEETTAVVAAEEVAEEAAETETPDLLVPPVAPAELDDAEKPEPPVILDVTDLIEQIRSFIEANDIEILNDVIIENWDKIEKVDVHFHANEKPAKPETDDAEKPVVEDETEAEVNEDGEEVENASKPLKPVHLELTDLFFEFRDMIDLSKIDFIEDDVKEKILNAKDVHADVHFTKPEAPAKPVIEEGEKPEPPAPPVAIEDGEKPEPPAPPVAIEDGEKPEPPAPPVAPADGEKPEPPAPPVAPEAPKGPAHHEHLGPKEREALKAAQAEAETATEAVTEAEVSE